MRKILADLYGVGRSSHRKKSLKEWLEDEIKASEQEITTMRKKSIGQKPHGQYIIEKAEKPHGQYIIEKAEKKLERLRKELTKLEKS
jgi:hypothetical protein